MQQVFHEIILKTKGQGFYDFTEKTLGWLNKQKINNDLRPQVQFGLWLPPQHAKLSANAGPNVRNLCKKTNVR